jgi:UDP-glucose:(glucosyl)LPS alpha-1,2-glucosyltransferase
MQFSIVDNNGTPFDSNGDNPVAIGGTEMMKKRLMEGLPQELKDKVNVICSRVRDVDEDKSNVLWLHDMWNDPESLHLRDESSRERFAKLVFVSNYQQNTYNLGLGVPYAESIVLKNAIDPFDAEVMSKKEKDGPLRLIYHTTPHRGLELLVPVFEHLYENYGDQIVLDVYSNFDIYGWPQRNEPYEPLFERCREHPGINYHGSVPNSEVRTALESAHIFAYPNIWLETSCIAAMEAMSAGVSIVCPNYGALPETTAGLAAMYQWDEDMNRHAQHFAMVLNHVIENYWHEAHIAKIAFAKNYADNFYNWDVRMDEWKGFLTSL